jgi:hypothetical protein
MVDARAEQEEPRRPKPLMLKLLPAAIFPNTENLVPTQICLLIERLLPRVTASSRERLALHLVPPKIDNEDPNRL